MSEILKTTTSLIAANAENRIFQSLGFYRGFGHGVSVNATTSTNSAPKELTLKDIEQAVDKLRASDSESQERLIKIFRSIGFNVMINKYAKDALVILPSDYEEAIKKVKESDEQKVNDES
jgi:hypothetical protein